MREIELSQGYRTVADKITGTTPLPVITHPTLSRGLVIETRDTDTGKTVIALFPLDGSVRTILETHVTFADEPRTPEPNELKLIRAYQKTVKGSEFTRKKWAKIRRDRRANRNEPFRLLSEVENEVPEL